MLESVATTETDAAIAEADPNALATGHRVVTERCGLLDRSDRGKLALSGAGAVEFLDGQVTNELAGLRPGEGRYAAFLTHKGKMLGDVRILAVAPADGAGAGVPVTVGVAGDERSVPIELLLDTERVALQALFDMIRRYKIGFDVELRKRTLERGLLSLLGPDSERVAGVLAPDADASVAGVAAGDPHASAGGANDGAATPLPTDEHASAPVAIDGVAALAIRTDVGVDLLCEASDRKRLRDALLGRGALGVSEQAAECVRVERGRPRFGVDIDESTIPQEAGLNERAVSFTKGCYVGQETVARLFYKGKPNRHLRGLRLSAPAATGAELRLAERVVGALGSVALSTEHGPIALALLRREAEPGAHVAVGAHGASAIIVELPFVSEH
jgi:folate-binding protein YgfZ